MKIKEIAQLFRDELKTHFPADEIEAIISHSLNEILGLSKGELAIGGERLVKVPDYEKLKHVIAELKTNKPLQYILGTTEFYGCKLRVNEHVLIPRPETEELVDLIISDQRASTTQDLSILDIGCGSGCIAIALKKNIPDATVSALDISDEALLIAKANALLNQAKINFLQADILAPLSSNKGAEVFDIIVSNPPYVRISEKEKMDKNVVEHEPHIALFVNDNDPLLFYNTIADFASRNLSQGGKLYFEINETLGNDVKKLLEGKGFKNVEVKKDMSGKDRIAVGSKQ